MLGLQNEREWGAFCKQVLRRPELATDERFASNPKRVANRQALRALIDEVFEALSAEQLIARLEDAQIANARMNDMHGVWQHPQLKARARWTEVGTPAGPIPALLPPGATDAFTPCMNPVPALGQHTEAILESLGWRSDQIQTMKRERAI